MKREDKIIMDVTRDYLQHSNDTQRTFAETKLYPLLEEDGCILARTPRTIDDYSKRIANMQNQFTRVMNETLLFPLAWKWAWIHALPDPYQARCIQEINSLIPSVTPSAHGSSTTSDLARYCIESGEAIAALTIIAADGVYDAHDNVNDVKNALNELYDARDHAQSIISQIEKATGVRVARSEKPRDSEMRFKINHEIVMAVPVNTETTES